MERAPIFKINRRDGSEIQVQFESNLVMNSNIKGFRTVLTDVTEIKKTKEELRRANMELDEKVSERTKDPVQSQAQLNRTVEELARSNSGAYAVRVCGLSRPPGTAAHGRQLPVTSGEKVPGSIWTPPALEYIDHAVSGGKRMRELIDDLLKLFQVEQQTGSSSHAWT